MTFWGLMPILWSKHVLKMTSKILFLNPHYKEIKYILFFNKNAFNYNWSFALECKHKHIFFCIVYSCLLSTQNINADTDIGHDSRGFLLENQ